MDYKKKYEDALERAKKFIEANPLVQNLNTWIKETFPELAESEDERIRKDIKRAISVALDYSYFDKETANDCLAWLEKQGEQKSAWSEDDNAFLDDIICKVKHDLILNKDEKDWLKSLKERYTWKPSEEQIKVCKEVYADILSAKGFDLGTVIGELNRLEEQLKKLREE